MFRPGLLLGSRYPPAAVFLDAVLSTGIISNTTPLTKPAGIAVGDLLLAACLGDATTATPVVLANVGGGAWTNIVADTWPVLGYHSQICWKVCTSGDLANDWKADFSLVYNDTIQLAAYRGGTQFTLRGQNINGSAQTDLVLPGFLPSAISRKIVSLAADRDVGSLLTTPAGFDDRLHGAAGAFNFATADIDPRSYVDNAAITWTDVYDAPGFGEAGYLLEIT